MHEDELRATLTQVAQRAESSPDSLSSLRSKDHARQFRRKTTTALTAVAGIAVLAVAAVQILPRGEEPGRSFGNGNPTQEPAEAWNVDMLAIADNNSLAIYEWVEGEGFSRRTATSIDSTGAEESQYAFIDFDDEGVLWQVISNGQASIIERQADPLGRTGGAEIPAQTVIEVDAHISAVAIESKRVAWIENSEQGMTVNLLDVPSEIGKRQLWKFPAFLGRSLSEHDSVSLEWSPNGEYLLVTNTYVDTAETKQDETLLVMDAAGNLVVPARNGSHAVWLDNHRVAFTPYLAEDGDQWRILDITTDEETLMPLDLRGANSPALSPDRKLLAVADESTNTVTVLDLEAGTTKTVEGADPLWVGSDALLVNEMVPCGTDCIPTLNPTGKILLVDLSQGTPTVRAQAGLRDAGRLHTATVHFVSGSEHGANG